jgi:hypothetical protein
MPVLGYDVDLRTTQLLINEEEAERVRAIFGCKSAGTPTRRTGRRSSAR